MNLKKYFLEIFVYMYSQRHKIKGKGNKIKNSINYLIELNN